MYRLPSKNALAPSGPSTDHPLPPPPPPSRTLHPEAPAPTADPSAPPVPSPPRPTPLRVRILSGAAGSLLTALAVTPLEVVKVRQQAHPLPPAAGARHGAGALLRCTGCGTFLLDNGIMRHVVRKEDTGHFRRVAAAAGRAVPPTGAVGILRHVFRTEGVAGIYSGLSPTLAMAIPSNVLYFAAYDELSARLRAHGHAGDATPLLAGPAARVAASAATSPLELVRTRAAHAGPSGASLLHELRRTARAGGTAGLWSGLRPTLWRDVPFSAAYWLCLERSRGPLLRLCAEGEEGPPPTRCVWAAAFLGGAGAGAVAAALTTPFDVVKTRAQVADELQASAKACDPDCAAPRGRAARGASSMAAQLQSIYAEEGAAGLWRGNATRMLKVAPACAIMISSYELGKQLLTEEC